MDNNDHKMSFFIWEFIAVLGALLLFGILIWLYAKAASRALKAVSPRRPNNFFLRDGKIRWEYKVTSLQRWAIYAWSFAWLGLLAWFSGEVFCATMAGKVSPSGQCFFLFPAAIIIMGIHQERRVKKELKGISLKICAHPDIIPNDDSAARLLEFGSVGDFEGYVLYYEALRHCNSDIRMRDECLECLDRLGFTDVDTERWWVKFKAAIHLILRDPVEMRRWTARYGLAREIVRSEYEQNLARSGSDINSLTDEYLDRISDPYMGERQNLSGPVTPHQEDEDLIEECRQVLIQEGRVSTSLLQRRLRLGYTRAARIIEILENRNFSGTEPECPPYAP